MTLIARSNINLPLILYSIQARPLRVLLEIVLPAHSHKSSIGRMEGTHSRIRSTEKVLIGLPLTLLEHWVFKKGISHELVVFLHILGGVRSLLGVTGSLAVLAVWFVSCVAVNVTW